MRQATFSPDIVLTDGVATIVGLDDAPIPAGPPTPSPPCSTAWIQALHVEAHCQEQHCQEQHCQEPTAHPRLRPPWHPDPHCADRHGMGAPRHARKMLDWGADLLIAQGGEGGGHTGSTATTCLVPAVVDAVGDTVPVFAAGGFSDGRGTGGGPVLWRL